MDDIGCFDDDRDRLRDVRGEITTFLVEPLRLHVKERATRLTPCIAGVPWLGFAIFPGLVRLRPGNRRRAQWRLRHLRWRLARGDITSERYRRAVASLVAHLDLAHTVSLRRTWFRDETIAL